ncbi:MAG: hypothetical protein RSB96_03160 [Oscillospiraceae bacterium]
MKRMLNLWVTVLILLLAVLLINYSKIISVGILDGINTCIRILVPSLLPFMILSSFIVLSPVSNVISGLISPITRYVFGLPKTAGSTVLMSMIGGYPIGAKSISELLEQKSISTKTASYMLCFCVNAGPSFLVNAVGISLFSNAKIGYILFLSQVCSSVLIGFILSFFLKKQTYQIKENKQQMGYASAFVKSVTQSSIGMIHISTFVVIFSAVLAVMNRFLYGFKNAPILHTLLSGFLEVTSGCISAVSLDGILGVIYCAIFISFGGISIIFQVMSYFQGIPINFTPFFISRFASAIFTVCFSILFGIIKEVKITASSYPASIAQPIEINTILITVCFLIMSTILLINLDGFAQNKINKTKYWFKK